MEIRISEELNHIINFSREEAMRTGSHGIGPDHLFLALIRHRTNGAAEALQALGTDLDEFKKFIDGKIFTNEHISYEDIDKIYFSRGAHNILSLTVLEATKSASDAALPEHLLLALCRNTGSGYGQMWLLDHGIDYGSISSFFRNSGTFSGSGRKTDGQENRDDSSDASDGESAAEEPAGNPVRMTDEFGTDMTKAATEHLLDPVVGREREISRVIQTLGRRKKNNPMLVGEPGTGKTAIVEGIAQRIASGKIPAALAGKRIISLDIASVVAGTKYRGDFEKRLKNIIREASEDKDIILFIDEFHTIVGAGSGSGSLDAANILKPALARGEIRCIGATTSEEFRKIVEKDGALDRRFQKIVVEHTTVEQSIEILRQLKPNYEAHHQVSYTDEAIEACARLSERYVPGRSLPDKAVDAMDEAGSMVKIRNSGKRKPSCCNVTAEDVATVISSMTGIPVNKVAESEGMKLLKMKDRLKARVIGQDEAIDKIVKAIQRNRAGIKDPGRPIGSFLFFGPTGVGKTQLAKSVAEYLFDSEDNMIRLDMSEYMEKFTASRLIGAPPGYVGFDDGGQLSELVRRKPYSVVLLDEIEKAHPDIFNILLQILDEGRLTDSSGRTVDFRNTVIIMTSNVGSREIDEYGGGIGFSTSSSNVEDNRRNILEKAVKRMFPPEFINRIDERIFFNSLGPDAVAAIMDIELKRLKKLVLNAGYRLTVSAAARKMIAEAGFDPTYGARPMKRAVRTLVEDPVSEFIIEDRINPDRIKGPRHIHVVPDKNGKGTAVVIKS